MADTQPLKLTTSPAPEPEEQRSAPPPHRRRPGIGALVGRTAGVLALLAAAAWGVHTVHFYLHNAVTDDAQVEARIAPVLPKVSGYVTAVLVDDNQKVTAGQPVVRIDDRELKTKVDTAQAAVENATAAVSVAHAAVPAANAAVAVAQAHLAAAKVAFEKAKGDVEKLSPLVKKEEVSRQQYDAVVAARDAAAAQVEAAAAQIESARAQAQSALRQVSAAEAQVAQRKASLAEAELQLSYAVVAAPMTGLVSKKNVEVGQFVQMGQPLLAVVDDATPWVVANFKETQLRKMRAGQEVEVDVDAYPGRSFHGKVDSFSGATGAKFALLPPDNATGNFVKVVQRVPVKIVLTDPPDPRRPLRAGMSVNAVVHLD